MILHHNKELFKDAAAAWNQLRVVYTNEFKNLVYGVLPDEKDVATTLNRITTRLSSIKWTVQMENKK